MTRWSDVLTTGARPAPTTTQRSRRTRRTVGTAAFVAVVLVSGVASAATAPIFGTTRVGASTDRGILLADNQYVKPYGVRTLIDNGRLLSSTVSPDGSHLAALTYEHGTGFLSVFDLRSGKLLQQVGTGTATDPKIGDGTVAADGPFYTRDGRSLFFPQTADVLRFAVGTGGKVTPKPTVTIALTDATVGAYLPSGMAQSADGKQLYVALNGANTLGVVDIATNTLTKQIKVGVAPRQVVLTGNRAFVSNEGGRPTTAADTSTNGTNIQEGPGTQVVSDPSTGAVDNGTLSVVDLTAAKQTSTVKVGLEPTALTLAGSTLFVANSNDDSMSVVDTASRKVTQTVNVNPLPGSTVGSYPNAITMSDPQHVVVSIGRDNALAVYRFNGATSPMQYEGLVPTDFYPVGVVWDAPLQKFVVTNDKGIGSRGPESSVSAGPDANVVTGHNTYNDTGSLTTFAAPTEAQLAGLTKQVFLNNDWQKLLSTPIGANTAAAPVAISNTLGEPSSIKHVFLIVKENRTYDQVLGDVGKGNSDPTLTQYGGSVTPNQHALATKYPLFDNFYDEGTLSADGHNWLMQADANDYIEKEFGSFYRSYPAQGGDALAYQRDGFLWNAAAAAGKSVANFGEYNNYFNVSAADDNWAKWYQDSQILEGKATGPLPIPVDEYKTYSDIPSLNAITDPTYPRFDTNVPDQYRTDIWLKAFRKSEASGKLANLNMLWVPDDHTAGTSGASPYPTAAVADNDLAVGRIVDAISHSRFWSSSAVFVLEDDSQNGTDHVDGHRTPLYLASPYAKRGATIDSYYTQLNVVKTIEQILGIAPMNQLDRAAEPIRDAFTNTANTAPFTVKPNQIPLTYGLATSTSASAAPAVPASATAVAAQWQTWSTHQPFGGAKAAEDASNPAQLNRLDWYASTGWTRPYPGDTKVLGPYEVPGWRNPAAEIG